MFQKCENAALSRCRTTALRSSGTVMTSKGPNGLCLCSCAVLVTFLRSSGLAYPVFQPARRHTYQVRNFPVRREFVDRNMRQVLANFFDIFLKFFKNIVSQPVIISNFICWLVTRGDREAQGQKFARLSSCMLDSP